MVIPNETYKTDAAVEKMAAETQPRKRAPKVPDYLVWEVMDGKPLYRRGYKDVLNQTKTLEEIMGTSSYQSILTTYITVLLSRQLDFDKYDLMIGEPGAHLKHKENISNDIAIHNRLSSGQITRKYADFPPKIAIEIDIDIDPSVMSDMEYFNKKTEKMLAFGVEKVIWILTNAQKVTIATPNDPWLTVRWDNDIELIDGIHFNIQKYLTERGINV